MKYFHLIILSFFSLTLSAQLDAPSILAPREYVIDNIIVEGNQTIEEYNIIAWSGLERGGRFRWPSEQASNAIKKIWAQGFFEDVQIKYTDLNGERITLIISVKERPRITGYIIVGVGKNDKKELREKIGGLKGKPINKNLLNNIEITIKKYYAEKGRANCKVEMTEKPDSVDNRSLSLKITIDKGKKVRIQDINFHGNNALAAAKLRKLMKETKRYRWWNVFKDGAFNEKDYKSDLEAIIAKYNEKGFRDARIVADTVSKLNDDRKIINIHIDEGNKFFFRHITWVGNTKYSTEELNRILNIQRGDVYNMQTLNSRLMMDQNGQDVSSLYLDDGYLFFNVNPKEIKIEGDSIDIEIRIYEGKQARINRVTLVGNTKTSDYVVMREIRTKPGDLFRRSDIIRSQRELAQLKYFNPEKMSVNPKPNPADGTVDIEYIVEEQPSDQVELSAGYGGGRLVGTLGLSFNNFSTKRAFKKPFKENWSPLPSGDGQTFAIRAQTTGPAYQSYNASFIEPWLGGKKPNSLSLSVSYSALSRLSSNSSIISTGDIIGYYRATTASIGYGMRLKWPDDFFNLNIIGTYQHYDINNYSFGASSLSDGQYNAYYVRGILSRNSIDQPIYPRSGSNISLTLQGTLPYSSFMSDAQIARNSLIEYYKMKFQAEWYNKIFDNLVLFTKVNFGVLGRYDISKDYTQFERFYLGGSPMTYSIDGREIISLRGYQDPTSATKEGVTPLGGAVAAVKYSMELRYPVSLNPSATIYGLAFMDAGRGWSDVKKISPFEARKAAGVGVRVFMPMFGLLGFDIGYGFDKLPSASWTPTFMLGYNMSGW